MVNRRRFEFVLDKEVQSIVCKFSSVTIVNVLSLNDVVQNWLLLSSEKIFQYIFFLGEMGQATTACFLIKKGAQVFSAIVFVEKSGPKVYTAP